MFKITTSGGDFGKSLTREVEKQIEDAIVDELVSAAREDGLTSVDEINLEINGLGSGMRVDRARINRLANQKLSGSSIRLGSTLSQSD